MRSADGIGVSRKNKSLSVDTAMGDGTGRPNALDIGLAPVCGTGQGDIRFRASRISANSPSSYMHMQCADHTSLRARAINLVLRMEAP